MSLTAMGKNGLQVESVALSDIAARFGTPCYVYSRAALGAAYAAYRDTLQAHGIDWGFFLAPATTQALTAPRRAR